MTTGLKRFKTAGVIFVLCVIFGVVLMLALTIRQRAASPAADKLFWDALGSNLTEKGLTCGVTNTSGGSATKETVQLDLASKVNARAVTTFKQSATTVTTEEIVTTSGDYVRYTALSTTQANPAGKQPDFSKVLGVWSKSMSSAPASDLFARTVLGNCIVPLADIHTVAAAPLIKQLQVGQVFTTDFKAAKRTVLDGQAVEEYAVAVQPGPYIAFMKQVGKAYGLSFLDAVNTTTYAQKAVQQATFYISLRPSRIQKIEYAGKQRTVSFSDYGRVPDLRAPGTTISSEELQKRLQGQ